MREEWIHKKLQKAQMEGLERKTLVYSETGGLLQMEGKEYLNFASNDYLNLAHNPHLRERAIQAVKEYGTGSTSSRLVVGTLPIHEELEARIAQEKGYEAALLLGSGYLANAAVIPALLRRGDLLFADRLVHASIIDAARLSRARLIRFSHNDPVSLEKRLQQFSISGKRLLVVTESVFSMDGDLAPLKALSEIAARYEALFMVDEAHSTGTFGVSGVGRVRSLHLQEKTDVSMGTLSKALGGYGGFLACSKKLRALLVQSARAFIYTTAPPPSVVGAALGAFEILEKNPNLSQILQDRAATFRSLLQEGGLDTLQSQSQIIPILVGENHRALAISRRLYEEGIIAPAIRPPTVPVGTARLRLCVTLAHSLEHLQHAAKRIIQAVESSSSL